MMRSVSLLTSSFWLLLFISSCHKNEPCTTCPPSGPNTTSHSFNFTQFTFGGNAGSSHFEDVAIINDSLAYAVGAVYLTDSLGNPDPNAYNFAKWNGVHWELKRIQFLTICGQSSQTPYPAKAILSFSDSDIWIAMAGDQIVRWNGSTQSASVCLPVSFSVNKLWGESANSIYAVGNGGNILHYDGSAWTKLESGTTVDLQDVWGSSDGKTVWACGRTYNNFQSILLKYDGTSWKTVWTLGATTTPPYGDLVTSLWGTSTLYVASNLGIYTQDISGADMAKQILSIDHFAYRIRGSAENNIAVAGDFAMIWHYNGGTWRLLNETNANQVLFSAAVSSQLIVGVGSDFNVGIGLGAGLIYMGRRQ